MSKKKRHGHAGPGSPQRPTTPLAGVESDRAQAPQAGPGQALPATSWADYDAMPPPSEASARQVSAEGLDTTALPPVIFPEVADDLDAAAQSDESAGDDDAEGPAAGGPASRLRGDGTRDVEGRIRELEERLDRMIDEAAKRGGPGAFSPDVPTPAARRRVSSPPASFGDGLGEGEGDGNVLETAKELLSSDFYLRKWGRLGMRNRSEEVDEFGFDPVYEQKILPFFNFLYEKYFRVEVTGAAKIPAEGRCLLVANHSGTLPYDGAMLRQAVRREHPQHRDVRWLAEDFIFHFPFLGAFTNRIGAVRACQENAERLLEHESLVAVFPEGVKGIGKLFKQRYRLQRFGRGGFVKLCLRTGTPIVPVAIVGAEEANPMLFRVEYLMKALGLPYFPITPTFPLLGPLGLAPAPTKWTIQFGDPVRFDGHDATAADDEILVGRLAERIRATIQGMLDRMVGERRSVWFG